MSNKVKFSAFISATMAAIIGFGATMSMSTIFVTAENNHTEFSSAITAVGHTHGEEVTILPEDVRLWNESKQFDPDYLNSLYEYSTLHKEFVKEVNYGNEKLVEIYHQADAFNPVNNVLTWQSTLENVQSYTVRAQALSVPLCGNTSSRISV